MNNPIYLDHNATTPLLPEVVEAMMPYLNKHFGNPSSSHVYGRRVRTAVEDARAQVAALIGANSEEIVFTSGGTEANNLGIRGAADFLSQKQRIITSVIEHPATTQPCRFLERNGKQISWLPVDAAGRVRTAHIAEQLDRNTALVTIMHANNETGTIQPIEEISRLAHSSDALVHTDAAQSAGKIPVHVNDLGVDLLSLAGHKLYAPKGVGALYVRKGVSLQPVLYGASHERGLRPGTENVASMIGFGAACEIAASTLEAESKRVQSLRDEFFAMLQSKIPGLMLNGHETLRLPNTLNVRFPDIKGSFILANAPELAASTGSACHESGESASKVLLAMGITNDAALCSIRLTLGRATTFRDIQQAVNILAYAWKNSV